MNQKLLYATSLFIFLCQLLMAQEISPLPQGLSLEDKIRIREAWNLKKQFAASIWQGMGKTPFAILLIKDDAEYLMFHPAPASDFKSLGYDSLLKTEIYWRPQELNPTFLATFPLFDQVAVIVVGTPENTGKSSSEWIITLLHEHFHQYQMSDKHYQAAVGELGLQGEDQSGMWMLNYPFPYEDSVIQQAFQDYAMLLSQLIQEGEKESFANALEAYRKQRRRLREILPEKDYKYFSFQVWQEGIARYNEWAFLQAMKAYVPGSECRELEDFISFEQVAEDLYARELARLYRMNLGKGKRTAFYSIGFGEGILLDRLNEDWKEAYLRDKFYLENYAPAEMK